MISIEDHYFKSQNGHYYDFQAPEGWARYQLENGNLPPILRAKKMEMLKEILIGELEVLTEQYKALTNAINL